MFQRIVIQEISPLIDGGRYPAKTSVGERLPVRAVAWRDGHAPLTVIARWKGPDGTDLAVPMTKYRNDPDAWHATVVATTPGTWSFRIEAWTDEWQALRDGVSAKMAAGQGAGTLANDFETGAQLLDRVGADDAARALRHSALEPTDWISVADAVPASVREGLRTAATVSATHFVFADRSRASVGAWYEMFPRSTGGWDAKEQPVHGTLRTAAAELPRIAAMGFDVVYLTPVHPIGREMRKGRNDSPSAGPEDPGCPWAVGASEGGHDAIHPDLGDIADFRAFITAAHRLDLEVAIELALQCAPDHPWLSEHPEWFTTRPDGTIACAEDPPFTWTDIHMLNFDHDPEGLYAEVYRIVVHWIGLGVTAFRVDNPHTKPAGFWERLIWDVKRSNPEIIFLAEAFTRPAVQHGLSRLGFTQTYTYFMWRESKDELIEFGQDLVGSADYLRPNLFPSNHDVLPAHLQYQGKAMFAIRAALAATLSPSWGIYSGYEICENETLRPGRTTPKDGEKYQLRPRDFAAAKSAGRSIEGWIADLNRIRRRLPALHSVRTLRFHPASDDSLIAYSKTDPATGEAVLCVVTLDPNRIRSGEVTLTSLGLESGVGKLEDQVGGRVVDIEDPLRITLNPSVHVAAIYRIRLSDH